MEEAGTNMSLLIYTILSWLLIWLVHILFWRILNPKNHFKALCYWFFTGGIIGGIILWTFSVPLLGDKSYIEPLLFAYVSFHVFFTLSYISFFSLIEGESPSLTIISYIYQHNHQGIRCDEVKEKFANNAVIDQRIYEMKRDGLISEDGDHLKFTNSGIKLIKTFTCISNLLGIKHGG